MEGFTSIVTKEKRVRIPVKRQPVYAFLERTMAKSDIEKQKIKDFTASFIHNFLITNGIKKARFLTLPGVTWEFEKKLRNRLQTFRQFRIKTSFFGCESDYKVFCLSASKMPGSLREKRNPYYSDNAGFYVVTNTSEQVYLLNTDIFDLINSPKNDDSRKFNCVWFDTTNTVVSISKKFDGLEKVMADDSIVILTVLKGREHLKFDTNRTDFVTNQLSPFGYKLIHERSYFDTCNMLHLIYTRTKI